ncbi:MAG: hypothetical protein R3D98_09490 [Candidatus Krumholzibacteriia bacterium]
MAVLGSSRSRVAARPLPDLGATRLTVYPARADLTLAASLPASRGPVREGQAADAHDWPLTGLEAGAAVRCRVVPVAATGAWWQVQADLDRAVRRVGARVLWSERLERPGRRRGAGQPDEQTDLLRVDGRAWPGHPHPAAARWSAAGHRQGWGGDLGGERPGAGRSRVGLAARGHRDR